MAELLGKQTRLKFIFQRNFKTDVIKTFLLFLSDYKLKKNNEKNYSHLNTINIPFLNN